MDQKEEYQEALLRRQEQLEDRSGELGRIRFNHSLTKARNRGQGSHQGAARRLLCELINNTTDEIRAELTKKGRGIKHMARHWVRPEDDFPAGGPKKGKDLSFEKVGADVAAYLALKVIIDGIHDEARDIRTVALKVSQLLLQELKFRQFKALAPRLFDYRMQSFKTVSSVHKARSLSATARKAMCQECYQQDAAHCPHMDMPELSVTDRVNLGVWLINRTIAAGTGLVERRTVPGRKRKRDIIPQVNKLYSTAWALEWISKRNDLLEELNPVNMPMVVPPLRWAPRVRGGYRFAQIGQDPLIRHSGQKAVPPEGMPLVYSAINRIQETPWRINRDVLDLVLAIVERGGDMAGIPRMIDRPEPMRPPVDHLPPDERDAEWKLWKRKAAKVKDQNYLDKLERAKFRNTLSVARQVANEEAFYLPWTLDFRGRMYDVVDRLSPQGPDLHRGLLTFANARPVGPYGGRWLAVHLMNSMDKTPSGERVAAMTVEERVQWVHDHEEDLILQVSRDPFADRWWANPEEHDCLQLYAACVEWDRYRESGYSTEFVSGLPVGMDGSCNGLQHYAAMFRDKAGAESTNVAIKRDYRGHPIYRPSDTYNDICEALKDRLESLAAQDGDDELAVAWLQSRLIDRKLCKGPTMTFCYGSEVSGFTDQIEETIKDRKSQFDASIFEPHTLKAACRYLAKQLWETLEDSSTAAFEGMAWLQECARVIASERPVEWTIPGTGFRARQDKPKYMKPGKRKAVDTELSGWAISLSIANPSDDPNTRKQISSIAPNIIHGLDAAALMLTVNEAAARGEGIESFGMVHDCYRTVPGDAEYLSRVLRQEFYRLYTERDVVAELYKQFQEQAGEYRRDQIPEPPQVGTLDLGDVLASPYFFM